MISKLQPFIARPYNLGNFRYSVFGNDFLLSSYTVPTYNNANFNFGTSVIFPKLLAFCISGRIGSVEKPDPLGVNGIYQMRMTRRGKVPIKMKFYTPTNPRTTEQQANRSVFADAMAAWSSLTTGQKQVYNERAKKKQMYGCNLFVREYYQSI